MTGQELSMLQKLPLDLKIEKSKQRIREYYNHYAGKVYVSFSGGKDSTVLLHIVREEFPDVKAVYVDTGLEFPEIKNFVKTIDNVEILRPQMNFLQVIKEYGYPVISKEIAYTIYYAKKGSQWAIDRLNGKHNYGNHAKYKYLLDADFKISSICCDIMKKRPVKKFEKQTSLHPIVGTMADEGGQRKSAYLKNGCNSFSGVRPMSTPLGFWKEEDIWEYIHKFGLLYSSIYDCGYSRTGCMFCMFGAHLEKEPNRFQLMKQTHPQIYDYCINTLKLGEVLDFLGIKYK